MPTINDLFRFIRGRLSRVRNRNAQCRLLLNLRRSYTRMGAAASPHSDARRVGPSNTGYPIPPQPPMMRQFNTCRIGMESG